MEYLFANVGLYALVVTIICGFFSMSSSDNKNSLVFQISGFVGTIGLFTFFIVSGLAMAMDMGNFSSVKL